MMDFLRRLFGRIDPDAEYLRAAGGCHALAKACVDHWDYVCQLSTGRLIRFSEATIKGQWVHLEPPDDGKFSPNLPDDFFFGRGIDVRLGEIVWVGDCDA